MTAVTDTINALPLAYQAEQAEGAAAMATVRQQLAECKAANTQLTTELAVTKDDLTEARAAVVAEQKRYTDHMAQPAPAGHSETPTPTPSKFLLGASYGSGADKSLYKSRPTAARIFFTGEAPANIANDGQTKNAIADGATHIVYSWKGSATEAELATSLKSIPSEVTAYGCYWHEPEDNIADKSLTLANWKARTIRDAKIMRDCGVIPVTILMGYTLASGSGRNPADYYMNGVVDGAMFDYYMNPAKGKDDPEAFMDKALADVKKGGAKWVGLGECGLPSSVAQATAVDLVKRLRTKCLSMPDAKMGLYWSSGDFRFTEATANAWFDGK